MIRGGVVLFFIYRSASTTDRAKESCVRFHRSRVYLSGSHARPGSTTELRRHHPRKFRVTVIEQRSVWLRRGVIDDRESEQPHPELCFGLDIGPLHLRGKNRFASPCPAAALRLPSPVQPPGRVSGGPLHACHAGCPRTIISPSYSPFCVAPTLVLPPEASGAGFTGRYR